MAKSHPIGVMTGMRGGPMAALEAVRALGIPTVQLQYPVPLDTPTGIEEIRAATRATGVEITLVFCGFEGEGYVDIPTVRQTVGLVPDATRAVRVAVIRRISLFAQQLGVTGVAAHIGFIPEDATDPLHAEIVRVVREICDDLASRGQDFVLETGQETARGLKNFLGAVARPNLRINFDPANMILYGQDHPLDALETLHPHIESVHCKDGLWPTEADQLGEEVPFGEGAVDAKAWLEKLLDFGYNGPLTIEREIGGEEQTRDVIVAKNLIEAVLKTRAAQGKS